jgi:hypothetical protein
LQGAGIVLIDMLQEFFSHCYIAPVQFDRIDQAYIITNDEPTSQGSWIAWWDSAVQSGQKYQLLGKHDGGNIWVVYFLTQSDFFHAEIIEPGQVFEIPENITMLRIDLRLWDEQGKAIFQNIEVVEYQEPAPEPDPDPEEPAVLPIPTPEIMEERFWVGYKWGRNIFIMDTAEGEPPSIPIDRGDAYEVKGTQRNRAINLEIGNIITAEPDKEEQPTNE